jgi:protein tyrosine phosphatase (PTP) superfamily phosphohydrolase (DUF442 family)
MRTIGFVAATAALASLSAFAAFHARPSHAEDPATPPKPVPTAAAPTTPATPATPAPEAPPQGLPNFKRLSHDVIRGAQPEGDAAFAALEKMGVKTIVTVDGAAPDVATAHEHGLRYVHVPIGYDGIPKEKANQLTKAFTTLKPPFYVHCHHGQHRGPAACAIARIVLDGLTPEQAAAEMKEAGTDPKYSGLYASPGLYVKPDAATLAATPVPPETAPIPEFGQAMVAIDVTWDHVKAVKKASWGVPAENPDVSPGHEATILAEHFRELARRGEVAARPEDFRKHLTDAEKASWDLSEALQGAKPAADAASAAYDRILTSCNQCHAAYRDHKSGR